MAAAMTVAAATAWACPLPHKSREDTLAQESTEHEKPRVGAVDGVDGTVRIGNGVAGPVRRGARGDDQWLTAIIHVCDSQAGTLAGRHVSPCRASAASR